EGMDVETLAGPNVAEPGQHHCLGPGEIVGCRYLEVAFAAHDQAHGEPRALRDSGIVGEIEPARRAMSCEDLAEPESLRRLRAPELAAVDGLDDVGVAPALDRVGDAQRGNGAGGSFECVEHAINERGVDERAGAIVNCDYVRIDLDQALES